MPQNKYTNADLARFERKPLGITSERNREVDTPEPEGQDIDIDQLLAAAKGTLARGDAFSRSIAPQEELTPEQANSPSALDSLSARLGKLGGRIKQRHGYAMSQPAEIALSSLAKGIAMPLALSGYAPVMLGQSAMNLAERGTSGAAEHPVATAFDVGMLATPALRGLKGVIGARQAASATAANARTANAAERELVDAYAAQELAGGSRKTTPTILRRAHEKAGRVHGEETLRKTQLHPDYPELPALDIKRPSSTQGLMDALETYARGPRIERGMGGPVNPAFYRGVERGAPAFEALRTEAQQRGIPLAEYLRTARQTSVR